MIIKSFSNTKEKVHSRDIEIDSFEKEDPIIIVPRKNQTEIMEKHYNSKYFQLAQPPGAGKSTLIAYIMSKKLLEDPNLKVIIIVPITFISKTFRRMVFNHNGKYIEWDCYHDLCKNATFSKVKYLVDFIKNKDISNDIKTRILITTHSAFARAVENLEGVDDVFDNTMVVIDEAHHVMYEDSKTTNKIGNFVKHVFKNKLNTGIWLATATPYRSDNNNMIPKEIFNQFDKHFLPLDKHWDDNIRYIKSFSFNFVIYKQDQILNEVKEVFKLGLKKSIIFCPYVGHLVRDIDKNIFKRNLINSIKEVWPDCKILDLIETNGRDKRKEVLLDNKDAKHIDIILTVKIFNEGSDWIHAEQCLDLSPSNFLNVMYQRFGRLWRDYFKKDNIIYYCFLPFEAKFKDEDERRLHLSKSFNALAVSLLLQDIVQPIKYPSTLKGKHKEKEDYVNPFHEAIPDEDERSEILGKIIKKLMVMKSVSENPSPQDVKQWIKCALTAEDIIENQDEIVNYIGLIFRRQTNQQINLKKQPDWSNAFDIDKLIEDGFDKIWVDEIFENLRVFGTNVCTAETFKEFRKIISGKYNNIDEHIKEVEKLIDPITNIAPKITAFSISCQSAIRRSPEKFSHIQFDNIQYNDIEYYIKEVEDKIDPITNLAPRISIFSKACQHAIYKYPQKFKHIKFRQRNNSINNHIEEVEKLIDPITNLAPKIRSLPCKLRTSVYRYPEKFSHIQFEKNNYNNVEYYVKQVENMIDSITNLAPKITYLPRSYQAAIYRYPEKFSHIQFENGNKNRLSKRNKSYQQE